MDSVVGNCGLAAEALAALATKEDFANVALRSAALPSAPVQGTKSMMLLHIKGRRRVQVLYTLFHTPTLCTFNM